MQFNELKEKALELREIYRKYEKITYNKNWTRENIAEGFVGDVGDLMKLILAKQGIRKIDNVDEALAHELADCLWSVLVLADEYGIDLEKEFIRNVEVLQAKLH